MTRKLSLALALVGSVMLAACGGGGGGGSSTVSTAMVDSYGVAQPSSFDGGSASAAGINGTAADGAVLPNALVTVIDNAGRSVSTSTDSQGIYRARIDGFVPPLLGVVTKPDGSRWYAPSLSTPVARGFVLLNLTGLTDKLVSDVATAAGKTGSAQLTPALLAANTAALSSAKAALNSQLSAQISAAGLSTTGFDPVTTLLTPSNTGHDQLLNGLAISNSATTATVIGTRYSLGGSVNGLGSATGLSLLNGSETLSLPAGASSFSFVRKIAPGSPYNISVASQPSGLTCAVNNGSGVMGNAALTNVAVVCNTTTLSLGGSVSGLTSSGLVLANGSQTVAVPANASGFTFANALPQGASYWVTVQSQPSGATCTVQNGGGNIASSAVTSVKVLCVVNTYALGGSVSGLSSNGLVLGITAQTVSVPAGAASWSFPAGVAVGVNYNVTVRAQPVGANCSVSNGSGTMGAAAVNSVQVSCQTGGFSLGGNISGLTSSGLVLSAAGQTLSVPANSSSFSFASTVQAGSSYNVQVSSQPAGLTCSVSNGSGSMNSAVSNVGVTCSSSASTLGGSITGLSGAGLVLASNGQTLSLTPPINSFTFLAPLANGTPYNVTVPTQPTNQYCTVGNGTGTMGGSAITSVAVSCGQNTFTLSGTTVGLTGPLTLTSTTGTETVAVSAASPGFSFPKPVATGTAYRVYTPFPALQAYGCNAVSGAMPPGGVTVRMACFDQYPHTLSTTGLAAGASMDFTLTYSYPSGQSPDLTDTVTRTITSQGGTLNYYLPVGATYSYTVSSQPATGSCALANNSGQGTQTTGGSRVQFVCQ
ncbi:hypothetical protein PSQ40_08620 [Curvibacter sp. HBC61]|uniref:Carboxypeptidase regulatory-like domain-containing protein n=1 Tax=Curvibacter cyanobacteriorum TaxID=3026422 RepID=A0ABT5MXT5_9BURK|nr:hypothetical protein [Curvibacter sp. HBC61]MDD0838633.1 hypothetical protein [Curvibacter sp. HBC61]